MSGESRSPHRLPRSLLPLAVIGSVLVGSTPSHVALALGADKNARRKHGGNSQTQLSAREGRRGSEPLKKKEPKIWIDFARLGKAEAKRARRRHRNLKRMS